MLDLGGEKFRTRKGKTQNPENPKPSQPNPQPTSLPSRPVSFPPGQPSTGPACRRLQPRSAPRRFLRLTRRAHRSAAQQQPQASAALRFGPPGAQQPNSLVPRPSSRVVSTPASHARPVADTAVPPGQPRLPPLPPPRTRNRPRLPPEIPAPHLPFRAGAEIPGLPTLNAQPPPLRTHHPNSQPHFHAVHPAPLHRPSAPPWSRTPRPPPPSNPPQELRLGASSVTAATIHGFDPCAHGFCAGDRPRR